MLYVVILQDFSCYSPEMYSTEWLTSVITVIWVRSLPCHLRSLFAGQFCQCHILSQSSAARPLTQRLITNSDCIRWKRGWRTVCSVRHDSHLHATLCRKFTATVICHRPTMMTDRRSNAPLQSGVVVETRLPPVTLRNRYKWYKWFLFCALERCDGFYDDPLVCHGVEPQAKSGYRWQQLYCLPAAAS